MKEEKLDEIPMINPYDPEKVYKEGLLKHLKIIDNYFQSAQEKWNYLLELIKSDLK